MDGEALFVVLPLALPVSAPGDIWGAQQKNLKRLHSGTWIVLVWHHSPSRL